MSDLERLKRIQEIRDRNTRNFDEIRFNQNCHYNKAIDRIFENIYEMKKTLDNLSSVHAESMANCVEIIASEDTIIKNEETVELKTNITGRPLAEENTEIILIGFIPSNGLLTLSKEFTKEGIKIHVANKVPKSVAENYSICGYHYSDPTTSRNFGPGIYRIEKGQPIGFCIDKKKQFIDEEHEKQSVKSYTL